MSSAMNHRIRSRRGYYKTKAFYGRRRAVVTPTARKDDYFTWFKMLRSGLGRRREVRNGKGSGDIPA